MKNQVFRWALIDIKTTGPHILKDKITEIAVIIFTEKGIESTWHRFFSQTQQSCVEFSNVACDLMSLIHDCVLVAHNARFEYAFLKNAFKSCGLILKSQVLCTIKLFKNAYPELKRFHLTDVAQRLSIEGPQTQDAKTQVSLLHTLLVKTLLDASVDNFCDHAKQSYRQSSLPSLLKTDIHAFPDSPGIYLFYSTHSSLPIYIGKSIHLRQRILSHFQSDHQNPKEFKMAQQIERVEIMPTAGELSALLLESALIKEKMPLFNRRLRRKKNRVGFKLSLINDYLTITLSHSIDESGINHELYGSFKNQNEAKKILISWVKTHQLCPKHCGLETGIGACFSYHIKRCLGACMGKESSSAYNQRMKDALLKFKQDDWPFKGPIAIKEHCVINDITQYSVFDQWRHTLSVIKTKNDDVIKQHHADHDVDTYKILSGFLKKIDSDSIIHWPENSTAAFLLTD